MGLAANQEIEKKPEVHEPWSVRRLFPFAAVSSAITKTFTNPFDILLGYLVFILGIVELIGRHVSWVFWGIVVLILIADVAERHIDFLSKKEDNKK